MGSRGTRRGFVYQEALSHLGAAIGLPDVLVSDLGMHSEDGYDLIRKVRALRPEQEAAPGGCGHWLRERRGPQAGPRCWLRLACFKAG